MGANNYTIPWGQVETLVQDHYLPSIRDQYFFENALYYRMRKRAKHYSGGRAIVQGLSFAPEGGGGQWWAGWDKMDTRERNVITAATYFRKNYSVPVAVSRDEEDSVGGDTATMKLVTAKMNIARPTAVDAIGTALFNDGTDPSAIGGLQIAIKSTPDTLHTYGGIPTSSTSNSWWRNQADVGAGGGYITGPTGNTFAGGRGFGPVGRMWTKIGRASGKRPTMIISNWGAYQDYHDSLAGPGGAGGSVYSGGQRYQQDADLASAGFENVKYKRAAWVVDERAPHDSANKEVVFFIHEPSMNLIIHSKRDMSFDGWHVPYDQRGRLAYIDWSGELVTSERRSLGGIFNIDTTATS